MKPTTQLSDSELLNRLTGTPTARAAEALARYGGLVALNNLDTMESLPDAMRSRLEAATELNSRLARAHSAKTPVDSPEAVFQVMAPQMRHLPCESLRVILLDSRLMATRFITVSDGSVNETLAHPRDILRPAVVDRAYAFHLVHNHPSGDPSPSRADRDLTRRVMEAAEMLQIRLLDHVIIGKASPQHDCYFSFQEAGLI